MPAKTTGAKNHKMACVPQKNSTPELKLRRELHRRGFRYRLHVKSLPGSPDLVFSRKKVAVFVNGCFWHRHEGCPRATFPRTNQRFWEEKFMANVRRDQRNCRKLTAMGWRPVVVWECQIEAAVDVAADLVSAALNAATEHQADGSNVGL